MCGLALDNLSISLGKAQLLEVNDTIKPGETLTIMGPSGSGKSTLLACVAGFLRKPFTCTGHIRLNGRDLIGLSPQERRLGLMFQSALLFPHLNIRDNLLFALRPHTHSKAERHVIAERALAEIGLPNFGDRDPATLSGGQQTRVALMRVLLAKPEALLLDEPFSSLDETLREEIRNLVFTMAKNRSLPVLLVTHDIADHKAAGGRLIRIGS